MLICLVQAVTCAATGLWSRTSIPSCAKYQAPVTRSLEITLKFSTSYCASAAEKTKMEEALTITLTDLLEISCLKNKKCEITDFTCAKDTESSFKLSFKLNQISDMTDITILTVSAAEVTSDQTTLTFTISTNSRKKRSLGQLLIHQIKKRSTTFTLSPNTVASDPQASTCSSNTFLENNLCGKFNNIITPPPPNIITLSDTLTSVACPSGYYLNNGGCSACSKGSYNPSEGAVFCTTCPTDTTTLSEGSNAVTRCTKTCVVPQVDNVNTTTIPVCYHVMPI